MNEKPAASYDMKAHRARYDRAWSNRTPWTSFYDEAYKWGMPYRRPKTGLGEADKRTAHLFDNTGVVSTFRGAGQLHQDLFPPGSPFFKLKPGPVTKLVAKAQAAAQRGMGDNGGPPIQDESWFERQLDDITAQITPFLQTGEWDLASSELCLDLYAGTGVMLILRGESVERPIRFVCVPVEEVAIEAGPYGDVGALFWKTMMSRRAIKAAFPKGSYPVDFQESLEASPDDEIELRQDFVRDGKGWRMVVHIDGSDEPVAVTKYKTQPFVAPRYYRVPGESYGRGPLLLALPTIKTANKVLELTLKASAISLLGIWGYRPGGTFNPNTSRLAPGSFWPMQATGGVMGPDVVRLDQAPGSGNLSSIVLNELRSQIRDALHDAALPEGGMTPKSAAEIMARMARVKQNYVGAFGRLIHEIVPYVVPRVIEILYSHGLITYQGRIDQLLVAIEVTSPMAQALKADTHKTTVEAMQLVAMLEGPQGVARRFDLDKLLPEMIRDLGVKSEFVRNLQELKAWDEAAKQAAQAQQITAAALKKPKEFADVIGGEDGAQAAPA
jgi:hypothetical protein